MIVDNENKNSCFISVLYQNGIGILNNHGYIIGKMRKIQGWIEKEKGKVNLNGFEISRVKYITFQGPEGISRDNQRISLSII